MQKFVFMPLDRALKTGFSYKVLEENPVVLTQKVKFANQILRFGKRVIFFDLFLPIAHQRIELERAFFT